MYSISGRKYKQNKNSPMGDMGNRHIPGFQHRWVSAIHWQAQRNDQIKTPVITGKYPFKPEPFLSYVL